MTMGIGFIVGDSVFLAADKRSSGFNANTGTFSNIVSNSTEKIIIINENTALCIGGLAIIGDEIKSQLLQKAHNGELNSIEQIKYIITEMCQQGHILLCGVLEAICHKGIGTITVILATYDKERKKPLIIGFTDDNNFEPVEYISNNSLVSKSTNDDLVNSTVKKLNSTMDISYTNVPIFLKQLFNEVSKTEKPISPECDIFEVNFKGVFKVEGANKNIKNRVYKTSLLVANLINTGRLNTSHVNVSSDNGTLDINKNTITVKDMSNVVRILLGELVSGIYGLQIFDKNGDITLDVDDQGRLIFKGTITSSKIDVEDDVRIGDKLYISSTNFGAGIDWGNGVNQIYIDPASKAVFIKGSSVRFDINSGSVDVDNILSRLSVLESSINNSTTDTAGNHNHGILDGTILGVVDAMGNVVGSVEFTASGSHYHSI